MKTSLNQITQAVALCAVAVLGVAGCKKTADNSLNYKSALNTYYDAHPACLWTQSKKFPTQANTSDGDKTAPFDALVDQGLLVRTTGEKKELIILSKQVTNYDLSDQGRSAWTADVNQPGYGNFCYGHWSVSSIDSTTPTTDQPGATTQVSYHYGLSGTPAWATAPETQNAFPSIRANLAPNLTGSATLSNTTGGWVVSSASGSTRAATSADGSVVE
ncbi:hypothetical protein SAMN05421771_1142 [Granulicella pectinivorans]|uniref:Lipoprotein n=1 Tax=Granulicella pectinivorans TaxID=474950 RepID=A0A1I6LR80_9BACT|nr:hypothetical protein [Granulicella pectinivorans]SFS05899.1 hypothetical protein SAMN05421771_1142 [Granulicella pectinivorans]